MAWKKLFAVALVFVLGLVLVLGLVAGSATAQPKQPDEPKKPSAANVVAARELSKQAVKAYKDGDYAKALDLFTRINKLIGRLPTTDLYRARCLVKLNRLVEASEVYLSVARTKLAADADPKHQEAKEVAAKERQELMPRIPKVTYQVSRPVPQGAALVVDGKTIAPVLHGIPQPIDPGRHQVEVTGPGQDFSTGFEIGEGQNKTLSVRVAEAPPEPVPPPPTATATTTSTASGSAPPPADGGSVQRTIGWVGVGVGAASLLVGAITGGLAMSKKSSLDDHCPDGNCQPEYHDDIDSFYAMRMASTVTFIIGGVFAATGITLVLTAPSADDEAGAPDSASTALRLRAVLGPTGAALQGRF